MFWPVDDWLVFWEKDFSEFSEDKRSFVGQKIMLLKLFFSGTAMVLEESILNVK